MRTRESRSERKARCGQVGSVTNCQVFHRGGAMRAGQFLLGLLLWYLASFLPGSCGAEPPGKDAASEEPKKLNDLIEKSVHWYDVFPAADAMIRLDPQPVLRWRNVIRGQEGEAMMVVWPHNGRPVAMASIYPWEGWMCHEF